MANALNDMLRSQMLDMARKGYRDLPLGGTTEAEYRALSESMNSGAPSMTSLLAGLSGYSLAQQQAQAQQLDVLRNMRLDDASIDNTYANIGQTNTETNRIGALLPGEIGLQGAEQSNLNARTTNVDFQTTEGQALLGGKQRLQDADIAQTYGQANAANANAAQGNFAVTEGQALLGGKQRMQNAEIYQTYGQGYNANANAYAQINQERERNAMLPLNQRAVQEETNAVVSKRAGQDQQNQGDYYDNRVLAQTEAYRINEAYRAGAGLKDGGATTAPPVFGQAKPAGASPVPLPPGMKSATPATGGVKMDNAQKQASDPAAMYQNAYDRGTAALRAGSMTAAEWNAGLLAFQKWQQVGTTGLTAQEDAAIRRYSEALVSPPATNNPAPRGERIVPTGPYAGLPVSQVPRAFGGTL